MLDKRIWIGRSHDGNYASIYVFAESDRLYIGSDHTGERPALFVMPRRYYLFGRECDDRFERRYKIDKEVARGFVRLRQRFPRGSFPSFSTPLLVDPWGKCSLCFEALAPDENGDLWCSNCGYDFGH